MIDEHRHQLLTHRTVNQFPGHRGIHAARQAEEHLVAAHLRADAGDAVLDDVARVPVRAAPADLVHETMQYPGALAGVGHLRMELQTVDRFVFMDNDRRQVILRGRDHAIARGYALDRVSVAHPGQETVRQTLQQD